MAGRGPAHLQTYGMDCVLMPTQHVPTVTPCHYHPLLHLHSSYRAPDTVLRAFTGIYPLDTCNNAIRR